MFNSRKQNLFSEYVLDSYLQQITLALDSEIKNMPLEAINKTDEKDLVSQLVAKYQVVTPTIDEKNIDIDAQETTVSVNRGSQGFDFEDGPVRLQGLAITVKVPFKGAKDLFQCRASTYSASGTPSAQIEDNNLVLYYETTEKDAEKIKDLWKGDISSITQNLGWIEKDVNSYNSSIENNIKASLTRRKKEAVENKSLIDKLKE